MLACVLIALGLGAREGARLVVADGIEAVAERGAGQHQMEDDRGEGERLGERCAARGEDRSDNLAALRDVLGFLVRAQWDVSSCFACSPRHRVVGGFSEHVASPIIRIDYVQHALSAMIQARELCQLEQAARR